MWFVCVCARIRARVHACVRCVLAYTLFSTTCVLPFGLFTYSMSECKCEEFERSSACLQRFLPSWLTLWEREREVLPQRKKCYMLQQWFGAAFAWKPVFCSWKRSVVAWRLFAWLIFWGQWRDHRTPSCFWKACLCCSQEWRQWRDFRSPPSLLTGLTSVEGP